MTDNLFIDLFAYRQRENKDPLEDWLTECLAATLRSLPESMLATMLAKISGATESLVYAEIAKGMVQIQTQFHAPPVGRPDMLITLAGIPWILIENKVGHSVTNRENARGEKSHQLRDYASWLLEHGQKCRLPTALGFVTHITPPPPDFCDNDCPSYIGLARYRTSWGDLARELLGLTNDLPQEHGAALLTHAFFSFLEDRGMSNEMPDSTSFAVAEMYVGHAGLLENLVDAMWQRACKVAHFGKTSDYVLKPVADQGSVSAWRYIAPATSSESRDSWIEVGVWFPELDRWYDRQQIGCELRGAQVYLGLLNGKDGYFENVVGTPEGFIRPASDFVALKALVDFPTEPQARGEQIVEWVGQMSDNLRAFAVAHGLVN